jgi:hypothetical protein
MMEPVGAYQRREAHGVIAAAGADVADGHARLDFKNAGDLAILVEGVAVLLAGAAWADDRRDRTLRRQAGTPGEAR